MCAYDKMFLKYKENTRVTLDISKTDKDTINAKRRKEFHKLRFKVDLENKGIDAFSAIDLKRMYDLRVIPKYTYKR